MDLVGSERPPCPPADWDPHVAPSRPIYVMEAVQIWQREHYPGHLAFLVGLYRSGGIFDLAYASVAGGPLEKKALVVLGELDEGFGGEVARKEL